MLSEDLEKIAKKIQSLDKKHIEKSMNNLTAQFYKVVDAIENLKKQTKNNNPKIFAILKNIKPNIDNIHKDFVRIYDIAKKINK